VSGLRCPAEPIEAYGCGPTFMKNMPDPGITTEKILEENNFLTENEV
jgi:hypothetical protein